MKALSLWEPSERAAYISGVLHGDGWCTGLSLGLRSKDRDFADTFADCVATHCCVEVVIPKQDERGYWLFRSGNKSGRFSKLKSFVPTSNSECAAWLRGIFDSEGNANCSKVKRWEHSYYRRISIYSTDTSTIATAAAHMARLGMKYAVRETKNSVGHKGTLPVFELKLLSNRSNFQIFRDLVSSSIERKRITISRIVETYQPDTSWCRRAQLLGAASRRNKRKGMQ